MEPRGYYTINDAVVAKQRGYAVVMTVHLDADVPVGYFSWEEYDIMRPLQEKGSGPGIAAAFISNCNANNFRLQALEQLQAAGVAIDSFGRCANNRPYKEDKLGALQHYKFSLAFENTNEKDYVTEKFWQSLVVGAVPIVVGAPNILDFAPSNISVISINGLEDVPQVANKILQVNANKAEWDAMVRWKTVGPSDAFKALLDMSAVHSSCRLCIHIASRMQEVEEELQRSTRPCRCKESDGKRGLRTVYHARIRERGSFNFRSFYIRSNNLNLANVVSEVEALFKGVEGTPIWTSKRPSVLKPPPHAALNIYRIYPANATQRAALYEEAWFRDDADLRHYFERNPCPRLEVVFV
eukprot:SM000200S05804  [mRNA]  locus=s200:10930:12586:+ [translate_table: standard]